MKKELKIDGKSYIEGELYVDDNGSFFTVTEIQIGLEKSDGSQDIIRLEEIK